MTAAVNRCRDGLFMLSFFFFYILYFCRAQSRCPILAIFFHDNIYHKWAPLLSVLSNTPTLLGIDTHQNYSLLAQFDTDITLCECLDLIRYLSLGEIPTFFTTIMLLKKNVHFNATIQFLLTLSNILSIIIRIKDTVSKD